ncbi:MAG: hypothetical protein ACI9VR_000148 [Cognaticolwellia sp.]
MAEAAAWALKYPNAVAALLTAARFHDLTDAFEGGVWLYVPAGTSRPRIRVTAVRVVQLVPRFIDREFDEPNGIQTMEVHGTSLRLTGPDRTTLDLWRHSRHVSKEYAVDSLRRRVAKEDFDLPVFARLARRIGVWPRVEPLLTGLVLR